MLARLSSRDRLVLAAALLLLLVALVPSGGALVARGGVGLAALCVLGWWWARGRCASAGRALAERVQVVARAGLSARCGLALVEVDGQRYLVAHGDAFASIQALAREPR